MFAREGYPYIFGAAAFAAVLFALALRQRSWGLWLAAFVMLVLALWVAWFFRTPDRLTERSGNTVAVSPALGRAAYVRVALLPTG
jgi:hypothetical protein